MLVQLIAHTNDPEKTIAAAAKLCYSDAHIETLLDGLTPEKTEAFLQRLNDVGHASPIEHASFTFGIEGVSRTFLAQVTRHRIGSFSVQSQRYVRLEDFRYVIPPEIEAIPEAKAQFIASMNDDAKKYLELVQTLENAHTARFMAEGLEEKAARAKASKQANEDARFVLPNACETKMVMTMNCRSLQNFFNLRCCNRAQWEIRAVADEMLRLVLPLAPHIFAGAGPRCLVGPCPEGRMCCGKQTEVRAKYAKLKEEAVLMGQLIIFEGLDGSGKGTQTKLTAQRLKEQGRDLRQITFPDYDSESSALVKMYLSGAFGDKPDDVNAYAASSFYAVDRFASYKTDWGEFYREGGLVLSDRYTTSNAVHQCSKLPPMHWDGFLNWLFDFEYKKFGIPAPDAVIYLAVDPEVSQRLITERYHGDESKKDIQEKDTEYLARSRAAAEYCARTLGWHRIECTAADANGAKSMRSVEDINAEILAELAGIL